MPTRYAPTTNRPPRVKTLYVKDRHKYRLGDCPSFSVTGSVTGMRKMYYGDNAILVRCGQYIYKVNAYPEIYAAAH